MLTSVHVNRAVNGDTASLEWLVDRLNPLLLAQASWRLGPLLRRTTDPCDLVHEAWLVLLPRLDSLPPRDGRMTPVLLRFLSSTILGKVRNLLRREVRRQMQSTDEDTSAAFDPSGPRSEVVSSVVRRERSCQLRDALGELSESDREVILMLGIEQLPTGDVATHFSITREALSKRYRRALARLCERMPDSVFAELDPGSD